MTQTSIFIIGVIVSVLCSVGLTFSVTEMRRLAQETDRETPPRNRSTRPDA